MPPCPCGSGTDFSLCCGPILAGVPAPTAERLMRSRYSAFVRGDLDHIGRTSAGEAALAFDRAGLERVLPGTEWLGLEILDVEGGAAGDNVGFVTFRVRFREEGRLHSQTERSEFRRVGGAWRYWRGEADVALRPAALARIGRNDPCPCGSGKKYKKCCGAGPVTS